MNDRTWVGRALRVMLVVVMVLPFIGYFAPAASAHHPILSVSGSCNPQTFEWEITWTVANGNWSGRTMTVDQVTYSDSQLTDIKVGLVLGPNATESDTVHYPLSDSGVKTLTVRADWNGDGPQDVSKSKSIDLSQLDDSRCQPGSITVVKVTEGGTGTFGFSSKTLSPSPFDLTTTGTGVAGSDSRLFAELPAGTYDVAEGALGANWALTSATCSDESDPSAIDLAAGESVTCTFVNTYTQPQFPGTVTVIKNTQNPETSDEFSFLLDSYELFDDTQAVEGDGGSYTWYELPLGTYELTELVGSNPAGYSLIASSCMLESNDQLSSAASAVQVGTPISNGVAFELGSGDHVVCTFTNRHSTPPPPPDGSITIVKQTEVSTGLFSFSSSFGAFDLSTTAVGEAGQVSRVFGGLSAGTYSVSEDAVGTGWALTSATCSDGSIPSAIDLFQGEDVTCVFVNEFTQVSPTTVVNTTTTVTVAPTVETLPFTGPTSTGIGGIGAALVLLGGLVLLAFRKKDDPVVESGFARRLDS